MVMIGKRLCGNSNAPVTAGPRHLFEKRLRSLGKDVPHDQNFVLCVLYHLQGRCVGCPEWNAEPGGSGAGNFDRIVLPGARIPREGKCHQSRLNIADRHAWTAEHLVESAGELRGRSG
jgi:hypothetical protein